MQLSSDLSFLLMLTIVIFAWAPLVYLLLSLFPTDRGQREN